MQCRASTRLSTTETGLSQKVACGTGLGRIALVLMLE